MAEAKNPDEQYTRSEPGQQTEEVAKLLTSILQQVQKQVDSKTPQPLSEAATKAVEEFKQIGDGLDAKEVVYAFDKIHVIRKK